MKRITNKQYHDFEKYKNDLMRGRVLTPDGLRIICAGFENDPEKIGAHFLECLKRFESDGARGFRI